jgi:hypothetical protein
MKASKKKVTKKTSKAARSTKRASKKQAAKKQTARRKKRKAAVDQVLDVSFVASVVSKSGLTFSLPVSATCVNGIVVHDYECFEQIRNVSLRNALEANLNEQIAAFLGYESTVLVDVASVQVKAA